MQEKILNGKKNGMAMLLLFILLYAAAIAAVVFGAVLLEGESYLAGGILVAIGVIWIVAGLIPFAGLKVLKPQEALVLTLFGKYVGTLKEEGFYFVNPFCTAVNPAAKTRLNQSGDVNDANKGAGPQRPRRLPRRPRQEDFSEDHDVKQQPSEDQRLSGKPGGDWHRRHVESSGHGQGGV